MFYYSFLDPSVVSKVDSWHFYLYIPSESLFVTSGKKALTVSIVGRCTDKHMHKQPCNTFPSAIFIFFSVRVLPFIVQLFIFKTI